MAVSQQIQRVEVTCTDCPFSRTVERRGEKPADVILEHGRETGHTLTIQKQQTDE